VDCRVLQVWLYALTSQQHLFCSPVRPSMGHPELLDRTPRHRTRTAQGQYLPLHRLLSVYKLNSIDPRLLVFALGQMLLIHCTIDQAANELQVSFPDAGLEGFCVALHTGLEEMVSWAKSDILNMVIHGLVC
jgi:hypothetical protein